MVSSYEFTCAKSGSSCKRSHAPLRKYVAVVYGVVKGVPFRQAFKDWSAAERCAAQTRGQVVPL